MSSTNTNTQLRKPDPNRFSVDQSGAFVSSGSHDYSPFGLEIGPLDSSDNSHRFTGQERDAETGNDYMHFRYYGGAIGRFMKPDNVAGGLVNPQDWNLYSYVHGNPVNFNDPTGHIPAPPPQVRPVPDTPPKSAGSGSNPLDYELDRLEAIRNATDMVTSLIKAGGVNGSFSVTPDVLNALKTDNAFRNGFILWLSTDTGRRQYEDMAGDKNTKYTVEIGPCGGSGETLPVGTRNPPSPRGEVDYSHVRIILNTGDFGPFTAWQFAKTLGHEGFHAKDWGSGKYTLTGAGRHGHLLDPAYEDWRYPPMRRYYKEMAALGAFFPSAKGAIPW